MVELLTTNAMENGLRELKNYIYFFYTHGDTQSYREFLRQNTTFHHRVALASGNQVLANMVMQVLEKLERAFHLELGLRDSAFEMTVAHKQLVETLLHRDAVRAREIGYQEVMDAQQRIIEALVGSIETFLGKLMIHEKPMCLSINPSSSARKEVI